MPLERYRAIIPDWDRFQATILSRDPTTIRVRTGRISLADLADRLREQGFVLESVEGLRDFMRVVDGPHSVADTIENWLGLFYIQQASTGVAAPLLGPRPGERVPRHVRCTGRQDDARRRPHGGSEAASWPWTGTKTGSAPCWATSIEPRIPTCWWCRATVGRSRTGPSSIACSWMRLAPPRGPFAVKVGPAPAAEEVPEGVPRRQEGLLRRAIALTRPGGVVLYSTCTFAPEENEAVVHRVLEDAPVVLEPIEIDAPHAPGLTCFEGQRYDASLEGACRIYPHHLDSGGLFLARLHRLDGDGEELPGWSPVPVAFPDGRTRSRGGGPRHRRRARQAQVLLRRGGRRDAGSPMDGQGG